MIRSKFWCTCMAYVALLAIDVYGSEKKVREATIQRYVERVQGGVVESKVGSNPGSLWRDNGALASICSDYKARSEGDIVVISIAEQTLAQASGAVATQRTFKTNSGISGLVGRINTGGVNPLALVNSDTQLKGQGQTSSTSSLRTSLAGHVIAVLPNGNLVIQAQRDVLMNNQRQTISLRGVGRPGDIGSNNVIISTQLSDLEVELRGKGVVNEATRQPHWVIRVLLRLLTF